MYDATGMDQTDTFSRVAAYVTECLRNGPTLIHCRAGPEPFQHGSGHCPDNARRRS